MMATMADLNNLSPSAQSFEATTATLETGELLEMILKALEIRTLLLAQRVCRAWRQIISANSDLQKKLYLKPASYDEMIVLGISASDDVIIRPADAEKARSPWDSDNPDSEDLREWTVNPLVAERVDSTVIDNPFIGLKADILPHTVSARRGKASWERMYICQPPKHFWNYEVVLGHCIDTEPDCYETSKGTMQHEMYGKTVCKDFQLELFGLPLRDIMDRIETDIEDDYHYTVWWARTLIEPDVVEQVKSSNSTCAT